jgi:hypothetical protein
VGFSAGLAAAILCAASGFAHAQQQQYGQPPNTYVTWGSNTPGATIDVTYFVGDPSISANQANLIRQAAASWNGVAGNVRLVEVSGPGASTTANVLFQVGNTGSTAVVAPTTLPTTPGSGTFPNGASWVLINGQVVVTASSLFAPFYWDGSPLVQPPGTINFLTVALQMTGFAIGLGPAALGDTNSVMSQNFPLGPGGLTSPTANDVVAVNAIYGSPEPATFALFGVGLAALGFGRKRRRL